MDQFIQSSYLLTSTFIILVLIRKWRPRDLSNTPQITQLVRVGLDYEPRISGPRLNAFNHHEILFLNEVWIVVKLSFNP